MARKVKFGLKNVYYSKLTFSTAGTPSYAAPVAWPGAVNLQLDPNGGLEKFRADNIDYYVSNSNSGYDGTLETALVPDTFRTDILGDVTAGNGILVEQVGAPVVPFALLFQFEDDVKDTRHVMYNCTATRPSVEGSTTEETITPQTETVNIAASSVYFAALDKDIMKGRCTPTETTAYNAWFTTVQTPTAV